MHDPKMIAIRVKKNGKLLGVAGAEDLSVLSAAVSVGGPLGPKTLTVRKGEEVYFHPHIGGLTARKKGADVHVRWQPELEIGLGDKFEFEFIETDSADAPDKSTRAKRKQPKAKRQGK
jgi:hypothetical protein